MQSSSFQLNVEFTHLLAAAEQQVLKAEASVAKQCALLDQTKRRHLSLELINQAERILATLQATLQVHRNGLRLHHRIKNSLPTVSLSSNGMFQLLEAEVELEHPQEAAETLPDGQEADLLRAQLLHIQHALSEAERIARLAGIAAEPTPWWQEWQQERGSGSVE
jgi:hypothetical protein